MTPPYVALVVALTLGTALVRLLKHLDQPPHPEVAPGLSSRCTECPGRYFYPHPMFRNTARDIHRHTECTAHVPQENR